MAWTDLLFLLLFFSGDSYYNKDAGFFQVAGISMWLSQYEINQATTLDKILASNANQCANSTCSGYAAMRSSQSITQTSWGGGELSFT